MSKEDKLVTLVYQIDEPYYLVGSGVNANGRAPLSKRGDEVKVKQSKAHYILKCLKRGETPLFKLKIDTVKKEVVNEALKPSTETES